MNDKNLKHNGESLLYHYLVLSSYANFRTSYKNIEGKQYTIYPGEWICRVSDLTKWFRRRFQWQAMQIMDKLQAQNFITYSLLEKGKLVKFRIPAFRKSNKILDYNYPCQKDTGFFFFPIENLSELIGIGKCSEMDILLDLWINTVYNDAQVFGSEIAPVVYFRNHTGNPAISYSALAQRWHISKTSAHRILRKFCALGLIEVVPLHGKTGSAIYLKNYLSVMFNISDLMIDKEEVALRLSVELNEDDMKEEPTERNICVSESNESVPKMHISVILSKMAEILAAQGISCLSCSKAIYKLSPLSVCRGIFKYQISISCGITNEAYCFIVTLESNESNESNPSG